MAKTFLELLAQVKGILPVVNGGTGLSSPGAAGKILTSDGAGGFVMADPPVQTNFTLDGGASNTSYVGVPKMDLGGSV